jgi:hypothetical protein
VRGISSCRLPHLTFTQRLTHQVDVRVGVEHLLRERALARALLGRVRARGVSRLARLRRTKSAPDSQVCQRAPCAGPESIRDVARGKTGGKGQAGCRREGMGQRERSKGGCGARACDRCRRQLIDRMRWSRRQQWVRKKASDKKPE